MNNKINEHIQYISEALEASNQAFFSGLHMILVGIGIILIPILEWVFSAFLNLSIYQKYTPPFAISFVLHVAFYWFVFSMIHRLADYLSGQKTVLIGHPLIQKAFAIHQPIGYSIIGMVITFLIIDRANLIFPMIFILLGIMLNLYGRFSTKTIYITSWGFIVVGLVGVLLTKYHWNYLWTIGTTYLGLSYILMGASCKIKKANDENKTH